MNDELQTILDSHKESIEEIRQNIQFLTELTNILTKQFTKNEQDMNNLNDKFDKIIIKDATLTPLLINIIIWIATGMAFIAAALLLELLSQNILAFLDKISSWLTGIAIMAGYLTAAIYEFRNNKAVSKLTSVAGASIFVCYFWYITINYGAIYPHVSAIGFNIATILQSCAILASAYESMKIYAQKNFKDNPNA